jgi:hypothetical protein
MPHRLHMVGRGPALRPLIFAKAIGSCLSRFRRFRAFVILPRSGSWP